MRNECQDGEWVTCYSARGTPYLERKQPMPRIDDEYLLGSVYLYRSRHEAEEGINIGGSGFLVSVPCERLPAPICYVYLVTNKHVVQKGARTLRVNTTDGKFDTFDLKTDWTLSSTDDLAIRALPPLAPHKYAVRAIPRSRFVTQKLIQEANIGPGDEVAVIGRFINQEGKERNMPTIRFGHLAQMPIEPIEYEGATQESFICEVKSIGGFSGSPVYLAPYTSVGRPRNLNLLLETKLLGIDWAHIQNWECAIDEDGHEIPHIRFPTNTGMMAVVPAWRLDMLLDEPSQIATRQAAEEAIIKQQNAPTVRPDIAGVMSSPAPADSAAKGVEAEALADDANPNHLADFTRLVDVATRKRPQDD